MSIRLLGLLMLGMTAHTARADIVQTVYASISTNTCSNSDNGFSSGFTDATATAICPSASAFAGAGASGNVGLSNFQSTGGLASATATIQADFEEHRNPLPIPLRAEANFIIDGGSFFLDGVGSIDFDVDLVFRVFESGGGFNVRVINWHTGGTLADPGLGPPVLTVRGEDIGITASGFSAQIPLTRVSIDLGIVPALGFITINYEAGFSSNIVRAEPAGWSFSDPGNISGAGDFPMVTFAAPPQAPDSDDDGVPDDEDTCPETPAGTVVNAEGCAVIQLCPCDNPDTPWQNHGKYVSCIAHAAEDFVAAGLITEEDKAAIVSEAAQSFCGK